LPEAYKAFLLAVGAGLRKKEIDLLEWSSFRWEENVIRIEATRYFHPKSEDSDRRPACRPRGHGAFPSVLRARQRTVRDQEPATAAAIQATTVLPMRADLRAGESTAAQARNKWKQTPPHFTERIRLSPDANLRNSRCEPCVTARRLADNVRTL